MARFYALSIEPTLFGDVCLIRRWGRIGTRGQMKAMSFSREDEALASLPRSSGRRRAVDIASASSEAVDLGCRVTARHKGTQQR